LNNNLPAIIRKIIVFLPCSVFAAGFLFLIDDCTEKIPKYPSRLKARSSG